MAGFLTFSTFALIIGSAVVQYLFDPVGKAIAAGKWVWSIVRNAT